MNYYNIPLNFNHDNLDDSKIVYFSDHKQKKYITHWKHSLCNSQKLEFYNIFTKTAIHHRFILIPLGRILIQCFCNAVTPFYGHANKAHCCCCCCCCCCYTGKTPSKMLCSSLLVYVYFVVQ